MCCETAKFYFVYLFSQRSLLCASHLTSFNPLYATGEPVFLGTVIEVPQKSDLPFPCSYLFWYLNRIPEFILQVFEKLHWVSKTLVIIVGLQCKVLWKIIAPHLLLGITKYVNNWSMFLFQSITRCVPGVGLYFSSLHWLKSNLTSGDPGPLEAIYLGMLARSFSGVCLIPFTVIKTRFEVSE